MAYNSSGYMDPNKYYDDAYYYHYYQYNSRPQHYPPRRKLHKSSSTGNIKRHYYEHQGYKNRDINEYYVELDGEPLNELELLALKNAAINERKSKLPYYYDNTEEEEEEESTTVVVTPTEVAPLPQEEESTPVALQPQEKTTTKRRWPLSFLFKKAKIPPVHPTKSISTPPTTPLLSPSNNESIISSSTSSSFNVTTAARFWAFRMTPNQVWCRFDIENQTKLFNHMNQSFMLELYDSHLQGTPIIAIPSQRIAYYMSNMHQINHLELALL